MGDFSRKNVGIEACNTGQLYPCMQESPQMRWGFIRKVYTILCMQLLLVFGVAIAMFLVHPVRQFLRTSTGLYIMIAAIVLTFIFCMMLHCFSKKHPWNYIIYLLFTISMAFMIGAICTQKKGEAVLIAASLTLLVTIALTLFTFVAVKQGYDFNFLGPFLLCAVLLLIAFGIIRILFPMGRLGEVVIGCIGALVFSAFIIYDTDNLIKRFSYDEYFEATASLFLDIINLFLFILSIVGGDD